VGNASGDETNEILTVYLLKVWGFIPRRRIRVIWHSDQHYLAVGSGQGHWPGIFGGKCSNKQYLIFPQKRDNLFAGVTTFLTEREEPKMWLSILKEIQWLLYKIKKSKNIINSRFTIIGHMHLTENKDLRQWI